MNKAESNYLETRLLAQGWKPSLTPEESDFVILNTCSVRTTAEKRIYGRLGFFQNCKNNGSRFKVAVIGCMAERLKEQLKNNAPVVDYVIGTFEKISFAESINRYIDGIKTEPRKEDAYSFPPEYSGNSEYKALVPIMHGCDNFCSYCIVPYVRGREVSRNPEEIFCEIEALAERGVKEITLIGQNVNSYAFRKNQKNIDFSSLLEEISSKYSIPWIRFLTSHPKDIPDRLIDLIAERKNICSHIHLPVQHGSNKILTLMNRKYSREYYIELIKKIKERIPEVAITSDILIGFPGETEEDLRDTIDLLKEVEYQDAFTYYYNPIEGTKAFSFSNKIPHEEKIKRLSKIIEIQHTISTQINKKRIGSTAVALVESISKKRKSELLGRTERNEMVVFPGNVSRLGSFCSVKLTEYTGNTFRGEEAT